MCCIGNFTPSVSNLQDISYQDIFDSYNGLYICPNSKFKVHKREDLGIHFSIKHSTDLSFAIIATVHVMVALAVLENWLQITLSVVQNLSREGSMEAYR